MNENYQQFDIMNIEAYMNEDVGIELSGDDHCIEFLSNVLKELIAPEYNNQLENLMNQNMSNEFMSQNIQMRVLNESVAAGCETRDRSLSIANNQSNQSNQSSNSNLPNSLFPNDPTQEGVIKKEFQCLSAGCEKSYKFKWLLDRHFSSHKISKIFKCDYENCNKIYKSKENLTLHIKNIHLKEKPYSCRFCSSLFSHRNGCEDSFASKSALKYHIEARHIKRKRNNKKGVNRNEKITNKVNDTNREN